MKNITSVIKGLIANERFIVTKIEEKGCKLVISKEFRPCLILKFDPSIPDFVNYRTQHEVVPDFLYAKDDVQGYGLILVIEMSSEAGKSKTEVRKQLQSGIDNLCSLLKGLSEKDWNSLKTYAVYCGEYRKSTRKKLRLESPEVIVRGVKKKIVKIRQIESIGYVVSRLGELNIS